ncbi:MAG: uroporphyrinogen-III C-methyltransferase [Thermodesulfobacteriota bacterium]
MEKKGEVYLIGAGPGDYGLLTLKGKERLEQADVIVYDYLVNSRYLKLAKPGAEKIYVGKRSRTSPGHQDYINSLLVERASEGKKVARLKGGDPFVFGRGGEEAHVLAEHGIPFEVIPGVTSASAAPAYAGIPITHREYTSVLAVVTGHENSDKNKSALPWEALAQIQTLVFLMGVKNLEQNMETLIKHGKDPDTPAALISCGTISKQRTVTGTVGTIAGIVRESALKPPSIVVVGEVVRLREAINWFETKPLFGRKILVTRAREQASDLVKLIEEQGANALEFPTIRIIPPASWERLDGAIEGLSSYDWIVFTSVNGVERFFGRLRERGRDVRALGSLQIACIGEQTARRVEERGFNVDLVPDDFRAEGLIEVFENADVKGKRILIPRAKDAREVLPEELSQMGAVVDVVPAYETKKPEAESADEVKELLLTGEVDVITFASSSTARNFFEALGDDAAGCVQNSVIACIGPVTAKTVREFGFEPTIVCSKYTIEELVSEISNHFTTGL